MKKILFAAAFVSCLASCFSFSGNRVKGNGNTMVDSRNIEGFDGVSSLGSFNVYLTIGDRYAVEVETDENLQEYIRTEKENGRLVISTAPYTSIEATRTMKVYVTAPSFNHISLSGSGNIELRNELVTDRKVVLSTSGSGNMVGNIRAPQISADISGSGDMRLSGETETFSGQIAGSGNILAAQLKTKTCDISIAGSGNLEIHADNNIDAHIAGSGDVRYTGTASVNSQVAGSGSVKKSN